jgi:hypothetical protein
MLVAVATTPYGNHTFMELEFFTISYWFPKSILAVARQKQHHTFSGIECALLKQGALYLEYHY